MKKRYFAPTWDVHVQEETLIHTWNSQRESESGSEREVQSAIIEAGVQTRYLDRDKKSNDDEGRRKTMKRRPPPPPHL